MSNQQKYKIIHGPAHLFFVPSLSSSDKSSPNDIDQGESLPFRGYLLNLEDSQYYRLSGSVSKTPAPPSHQHHDCYLEAPIYYDLTVRSYKKKKSWYFPWVKWWNGDAGWMGTEEDGADPSYILDNLKGCEREDNEALSQLLPFEDQKQLYVSFRTQIMKTSEEALRHVERVFKKEVIERLNDEDIGMIRVCTGEMVVVVIADEEEEEEEGIIDYEEEEEDDDDDDDDEKGDNN